MDVGRITYWVFRVIPGVKVVKTDEYRKIKGPAIIVANHTGLADPHTVGASFPTRRVHFMVSKEVMNVRGRRIFLKGMGCIPVDRGIFDLESVKKCIAILKEGYMLGIFPQGTIVHSDDVDAIKSGASLMAFKADVPVIPMYISPKEGKKHRKTVVIGGPIYPKDVSQGKRPSNADLNIFTENIRQKMVECKDVFDKISGKESKEK